jgi:hypothetical protein
VRGRGFLARLGGSLMMPCTLPHFSVLVVLPRGSLVVLLAFLRILLRVPRIHVVFRRLFAFGRGFLVVAVLFQQFSLRFKGCCRFYVSAALGVRVRFMLMMRQLQVVRDARMMFRKIMIP